MLVGKWRKERKGDEYEYVGSNSDRNLCDSNLELDRITSG
jgi:hypothetical protein